MCSFKVIYRTEGANSGQNLNVDGKENQQKEALTESFDD